MPRTTSAGSLHPDLSLVRSRARLWLSALADTGATAPIGCCPKRERGGGRGVGRCADTSAPAWRALAPTRPATTRARDLPQQRPRPRRVHPRCDELSEPDARALSSDARKGASPVAWATVREVNSTDDCPRDEAGLPSDDEAAGAGTRGRG